MTEVWRLSGAGNDFLAVVSPTTPPSDDQIRSWCQRGVSLGADGVFLLSPHDPVENQPAVRMLHYNADGGRARLCVNGTRCAARLALELGWAEDHVTVVTDAGPIRAIAVGASEIELQAPLPDGTPRPLSMEVGGETISPWFVRVGVPHLILEWPQDLATCPVAQLGPLLRSAPGLDDEGANVNFVRFVAENQIQIRTFERGVEAETLACGSGILAASAVGLHHGRLVSPWTVSVASGHQLTLSGQFAEGTLESWSIRGDARLLGRTEVYPGAEHVPSPRAW
ncbi:MAG: diaminopimelate epimerase [Thermoanaerobaculia bacterium]|nr:diaminopimelate epimerase [Thermoanaerobaculia bacterium]